MEQKMSAYPIVPTYATHGMVATPHYLATQAGVRMLLKGGNAVDAAVAANLALAVVYHRWCSVGGDLFALFWDVRAQELRALNASGRAPQAMTPAAFAARGLKAVPRYGLPAVTVPGAVDGWHELISRHGKLNWVDVFQPAIEYAEEGFPISAKFTEAIKSNQALLDQFPTTAAVFAPGGRIPQGGERFRQPDLARSLRAIAEGGRDVFYTGAVGRAIAAFSQHNGGFLAEADLAAHRSNWVAPISTEYRGHRVYEFPPNSQGLAALEMFNMLDGYDLAALGHQTPEYLHLLLEAKKLAFADRDRYISDPDFVDIPLDRLLSKEYAARQRAHIDPERAAVQVRPGAELEGDTIYLCAVDGEGNAVSLIQSLFFGFGCGVVAGETGILLQNRGSYFSLDPAHVNYLQPGKRTMHTLTPAMAFKNDQPVIVFGTMGGDAQPQIHVQMLSNMLDFGMNPQAAISAPRWRSGFFTGEEGGIAETVSAENRIAPETLAALAAKGHHIEVEEGWTSSMGHAQAIVIDRERGVLAGGADPRADGLALGW
jgi:gamma-glutamyltranspeptidase/glutathione hydrolase